MGGGDVKGSGSAKSEPNVVPLCDILLVLLIIFMVVTPILKKGQNVEVPLANNVNTLPEPGKMVMIEIKKDGETYVDNEKVEDLSKIAELIANRIEAIKQENEKKVLIQADAEVAYGKIVEVMDVIRTDAMIEEVGLVTRKKTAQ